MTARRSRDYDPATLYWAIAKALLEAADRTISNGAAPACMRDILIGAMAKAICEGGLDQDAIHRLIGLAERVNGRPVVPPPAARRKPIFSPGEYF